MKEEVKLTSEEEKDYGVWHRLGLADSHLAKIIARLKREGEFPLGLLANCNSLMGMLAGLQHSGSTRRPLNVGLVWLDAHADFNTPETTLSGMLGGMPVACAAGRCLFRLRFKAGLDPAIATNNIIMMAVRDVDPLEQELIDDSNITMISTEDLIKRSRKLKKIIAHLSQRVDVIYIHIDLDVLDPTEIPGANLPAPNGPTADQLAESLKLMMGFEKVGALGIASFPIEEEGRKASLKSTIKVIQGALAGLKSR
jgi:arginase